LLPFAGFKPQIFVNKDLVIVSYTDSQVSDLSEVKPWSQSSSSLLENKPLAVAGFVNGSALVRAIGPWIEYGASATENMWEQLPFGDFSPPTAEDLTAIWNCGNRLGILELTMHTDESGVTVTRWNWVDE
jgi:hypothetical protein